MRAVADTNVVVSGLLWPGPSRQVLDRARLGIIELYTSPPLLLELEDVLRRDKLVGRLKLAGSTPRRLLLSYSTLAQIVVPQEVPPIIKQDPDDDAVLACALAARAEAIISGDRHLLDLGRFQAIRIITAAEAVAYR
jgi:putative PIN family toxin of toxin-antitoxin system